MKIILLLIFVSMGASAQSRDGRKYKFLKNVKTTIKKPFELRDPFVKQRVDIVSEKAKKKRFGSSFSNRKSLGELDLEKLRIVGVFLGVKRKALAKIVKTKRGESITFGEEVYILEEGMRLGKNRAEIKAILPGGIVLVERIKNVYEQDELLETIMPLYSEN
jgi:Tfp pilus assembly protein PilP